MFGAGVVKLNDYAVVDDLVRRVFAIKFEDLVRAQLADVVKLSFVDGRRVPVEAAAVDKKAGGAVAQKCTEDSKTLFAEIGLLPAIEGECAASWMGMADDLTGG